MFVCHSHTKNEFPTAEVITDIYINSALPFSCSHVHIIMMCILLGCFILLHDQAVVEFLCMGNLF